MPGAASGAPELRTLPAKGAPSQLRQSPSKRNGTLAPLACELWPPYRCPNPHRVCALNTGVGVLRGFLPRGLCDTGPQAVRDHRLGASSGQVSHNPKQKPSSTPRSWVRTNGQKADARINSARCWWRYAPSMACSRTWQCVRFDRENRTLLGRAGRPASSRGRGKQLAWCKPCAYLTQAESGRFAL